MELPNQFNSEKFRFLRIKGMNKKPIDEWKKSSNHFKYNSKEIKEHLKNNGNIGVLSGYGHLVVIDCDKPEVALEIEKKLKPTMKEKSANGVHFFFIVKDWEGYQSLDIENVHYGEIRGDKGHQTVIAPSIHPSGKAYEVVKDLPIADISSGELFDAVSPFMKKDIKYDDESDLGQEFNIPIEKIIDTNNLIRISNGEYQGPHPIHGSTTGTNFCFNPEKGIWHCFRHNCGGNALHLIAMKEGLISCGQKLDGKAFFETIKICQEKYGFSVSEIYKDATSPITFKDIKKILAKTIKKDNENKLTTFACMLLTYTEDSQFNIMFRAPSSSGKTYNALEISSFFPKRDVIKIGYVSPTAFFHDTGTWDPETKTISVDLSKKVLIFLDQPHDDLLKRLRSLLSHDQKELSVKITDKKEKGGTRTKNIILIGYPSVIFCSGNLRIDDQEATRSFILSPETSKEKLENAIKLKIKKESDYLAYEAEKKKDIDRKRLVTRIKLIKNANIWFVRVPNIELLTTNINGVITKPKPRHSRDIERLFSLIKCSAMLNFCHRERDGNTLIANDDDIKQGFDVWSKMEPIQEMGISPHIYRIFEEVIVPAYIEKNPDESSEIGIKKKEISRKYYEIYGLGLSDWMLNRELLPNLEKAGLISIEPDPEDKRTNTIIVQNYKYNSENYIGVKGRVNKDKNYDQNKSSKNTPPSTLLYISGFLRLIELMKMKDGTVKEQDLRINLECSDEEFNKIKQKLIEKKMIIEPKLGFLALL